eukprot:TRINITY_DN39838_c0_g1_i1.p1 TRINITY_DN39838_c0_g1~~TRINITY_DN39838_c0_g1_i1.p1  ORF type:complete len:616 (-),score=69.37 TRINITY_DN39838_c0_g1_i1:168-1940(-)
MGGHLCSNSNNCSRRMEQNKHSDASPDPKPTAQAELKCLMKRGEDFAAPKLPSPRKLSDVQLKLDVLAVEELVEKKLANRLVTQQSVEKPDRTKDLESLISKQEDTSSFQRIQLGEHALALLDLFARSKAERKVSNAKETAREVMTQLFLMKVFYTVAAWLVETFLLDAISLFHEDIVGTHSTTQDVKLANLTNQLVYMGILILFAPPLQYLLRNVTPGEKSSSFLYAVVLLKQSIPMILAWGFKNTVDKFLAFTDKDLWDECAVAGGLLVVVTIVQHIPRVTRAQRHVKKKKRDSVLNRYLCLPFTLLLSVAYAVNLVARYGITELKDRTNLTNRAEAALGVFVQAIYFQLTLTITVRVTRCWDQSSRKKAEQVEEHDPESHAAALRAEAEAGLGETFVHALSFLLGWALNDFIDTVYYRFLWNLSSESAASMAQVWFFGIGTTALLGGYVKHLNLSAAARMESRNYKALMKTALALVVGWAWQNICSTTTSSIVSDLATDMSQTNRSSGLDLFVIPFCVSALMLTFCWGIMAQIVNSINADLVYKKQHRDDYDLSHPVCYSTKDMEQVLRALKQAKAEMSADEAPILS